ncbi:MAG: hypothetical protein WKF88_06260 [Ferruginibacter sp.]
MEKDILHIINASFGLETTEANSLQLLAERINYLIIHDFNRLVQILYRADISEKKLTVLLEGNKNEDAGHLIAVLFMERQTEKIKSRREHRRDNNDIPEEERW